MSAIAAVPSAIRPLHRPTSMNALSLSSGDLTADRRADYARMLFETGDVDAACDLMRQALDLTPAWAAGWFARGRYEEKSGRLDRAAECYAHVLRLSGEDIFGAELRLAAIGRALAPATPPTAYVERLFDDYAERFDRALVEELNYSIPEKLSRLVLNHAAGRFARAIDLGCGTGLLGERLRAHVSFLSGYDLSRGMLAKAAEKGIYDHLAQADLARACETGGVPPPATPDRAADLVTAADVLMYFGDLAPVFAAAATLAAPGGYFAFSVEAGEDEAGWQLRSTLRFAHGEAHVRALCRENGFEIVATEKGPIRSDGGAAVVGLLVLARRHHVRMEDVPMLQAPLAEVTPEIPAALQ